MNLGHVALDLARRSRPTLSKHKAMSYGRMKEREVQLAAGAGGVVATGSGTWTMRLHRRYGIDKRGVELPEEMAFRESRLEKIREAMAALEA